MSHEIHACRGCGGRNLLPVLSLGNTPLANRLLTAEELARPEPTYPLDLVFCPSCCLVQITETVPPEELFREYVYFSSFSDTMVRHAEQLVDRIVRERQLQADHRVIEIASNDGYLLQHYRHRGVPVLGIEPAQNVAEVARTERGVETLCEFFGLDVATQMAASGRQADVIHSHNVLAHVADLQGFVAGVAKLLKPGGVWVNESPYLFDLLDHVEFDTIYHEHLCYFSLQALDHLTRLHGLRVVDVERIPIHGGTLRMWVEKDGDANSTKPPSAPVAALLHQERERGVNQHGMYQGFAQQVESLKTTLVAMLQKYQREGKRLAAYGASAKGSTLLNYCGIGSELLDFVADRSTVKQGFYTPGTHLPIVAPEHLLIQRPDYVLLLTWNFSEEILKQQSEYRRLGGYFIVPIPEPKII